MKLFSIVLFGLAGIFVLGWIIISNFQAKQHQSAMDMHPAMFEKPEIEMTGAAEMSEPEPEDLPTFDPFADASSDSIT
ncbi:MAG: hypothetical protein AAF587_29050 [Bacteroidota bacterium]